MSKRRFVFRICIATLVVFLSAEAVSLGATIVVGTQWGPPFHLCAPSQGTWSNSAAYNYDCGTTYVVGTGFHGLPGVEFRNFFTINLTGLDLANQVIVSVTLEVLGAIWTSHHLDAVTLGFFDVETDPFTLNNNTGQNDAIFADLGTGVSYGVFEIPRFETIREPIRFNLLPSVYPHILAAQGGYFSIGGTMLSDGQLFVGSEEDGSLLIIETAPRSSVPEPDPFFVMVTCVLGLMAITWRQRSGRRVRQRTHNLGRALSLRVTHSHQHQPLRCGRGTR